MVGTHGQLKNLYSKRILKFQGVRIVVFDEADEMLKVRCNCEVARRDLVMQAALASTRTMCGHCYCNLKVCQEGEFICFSDWKVLIENPHEAKAVSVSAAGWLWL